MTPRLAILANPALALAALVLAAGPLRAQPPAPAAPPAERSFASAAEIAAMVDHAAATIAPGQAVLVQPVLSFAPYKTTLEYRQAATDAAVHQAEAEVFHVLAGSGTLLTGGALVGGHAVNATNLSGSGITGGTARHVAAGDVLVIPEGTPHWFSQVDGRLVMLVMKVPRPVPAH